MTVGTKHFSAESRKKQILIAAHMVLQEVGVNHFTIDQIVDYLGIAKGTFYKYFNSKDDILAEVSVKALKSLLNYFELSDQDLEGGLKNTKAIMMSCYKFYENEPRFFELIVYMERPDFKSEVVSYKTVSESLSEFMTNHIARQQKNGFMKPDLDAKYVNYIVWGSCMGMMQFIESKRNFIENIEEIDRKKMIESFVEIMVAGLAA